jgi:transposase
MQEARKYGVVYIDQVTEKWLKLCMNEQNRIVEDKQNDYYYDLHWWGLLPLNRQPSMPVPDQQYSHLLPEKKLRPKNVPSEIYRNAVTYRFHLPWQLHFKNPGHFKEPSRGHVKKSLILTRELFDLTENRLTVKNRSQIIGVISLNIHRSYPVKPAMLCLSQDLNNAWSVSFSFDNGEESFTAEDMLEKLLKYQGKELEIILKDIAGFDPGVVIGCTDQTGQTYGWNDSLWEKQKNDQRRLSAIQSIRTKKVSGSCRDSKLRTRELSIQQRMRQRAKHVNNVGSYAMSQKPIAALEDTNLRNMLRKAKSLYDGYKYLPNNAAAKKGLTKALKSRCIGDLLQKAEQKLQRNRNICVKVPAAGTSITCRCCGHKDKENRKEQATFSCIKCNHTENADKQAAGNIAVEAAHGIQFLLYFLQYMKKTKQGFSSGTDVFYLLTGDKPKKTACNQPAYLQLGGLVSRVCMILNQNEKKKGSTLWPQFHAAVCSDLPTNRQVLYRMPLLNSV